MSGGPEHAPVDMYAAVSAARSSSSQVVTSGYTPAQTCATATHRRVSTLDARAAAARDYRRVAEHNLGGLAAGGSAHLLGHQHRLHLDRVETIAQLRDARCDLVKVHRLLLPAPLDDVLNQTGGHAAVSAERVVAEEREADRGDAGDAQRRDWRSERAVDGEWLV
jgi:hypothetical protein